MYSTTSEVFQAIKPLMPPGSDEFDVNDAWLEMANADVNRQLIMSGIDVPAIDIYGLLKVAEICFYMDVAKNARQIEYVSGDVKGETMGRYRKEYTNSMPMFFFATGAADPFFQLLPTETFRMRGYKYAVSFTQAYFKSKNGVAFVKPNVKHDNTTRGYGWEESSSDLTDWNSGWV